MQHGHIAHRAARRSVRDSFVTDAKYSQQGEGVVIILASFLQPQGHFFLSSLPHAPRGVITQLHKVCRRSIRKTARTGAFGSSAFRPPSNLAHVISSSTALPPAWPATIFSREPGARERRQRRRRHKNMKSREEVLMKMKREQNTKPPRLQLLTFPRVNPIYRRRTPLPLKRARPPSGEACSIQVREWFSFAVVSFCCCLFIYFLTLPGARKVVFVREVESLIPS